jgi:hypothetical protein
VAFALLLARPLRRLPAPSRGATVEEPLFFFRKLPPRGRDGMADLSGFSVNHCDALVLRAQSGHQSLSLVKRFDCSGEIIYVAISKYPTAALCHENCVSLALLAVAANSSYATTTAARSRRELHPCSFS